MTPLTFDIGAHEVTTLEQIGSPDVLVHLAWGGLPNYRSPHHMEQEFRTHSLFLESCIQSGLRKVVVAGTCLEYGMQSGMLSELMQCKPVTTYAQAKCALHDFLETLEGQQPFELCWLRIFYLYGEGQAPGSLYSQLRTAIASGKKSFDMSPGDQTRDFIQATEAARQIAALSLGDTDHRILNICSGNPVRVVDRVREWLQEWKADIKLNLSVYPYPDYEPHSFWGDPTRLKQFLETQ